MRFIKIFFAYLVFHASVYAETHHHHEMTDHASKEEHTPHESHLELGTLGLYPINREASGTSWQPESTPHDGAHWTYGDWMKIGRAHV